MYPTIWRWCVPVTTDLFERLKSEATLSYLGPGFRVSVVQDEAGRIDVYACYCGIVVPYRIFVSMLVAKLYRKAYHVDSIRAAETILLDLWARLDLGKDTIADIHFRSPHGYCMKAMTGCLAALSSQIEASPEHKIRQILGEITATYTAGLADPIPVVGRFDPDVPPDPIPEWVAEIRQNLARQNVRTQFGEAVSFFKI
jgi:hypothetical protein